MHRIQLGTKVLYKARPGIWNQNRPVHRLLPSSFRLIHTSPGAFRPKSDTSFSKYDTNGFPHKTLDQGHVLDTRAFSPDPHSEAARAGFRARHTLGFDHPHDAASPRRGTCFKMSVEEKERCGNKEGVGFVDQVGGQSAAVEVFEGIASGTKTGGTKGSGSG